jgi:hypothetical protein
MTMLIEERGRDGRGREEKGRQRRIQVAGCVPRRGEGRLVVDGRGEHVDRQLLFVIATVDVEELTDVEVGHGVRTRGVRRDDDGQSGRGRSLPSRRSG